MVYKYSLEGPEAGPLGLPQYLVDRDVDGGSVVELQPDHPPGGVLRDELYIGAQRQRITWIHALLLILSRLHLRGSHKGLV